MRLHDRRVLALGALVLLLASACRGGGGDATSAGDIATDVGVADGVIRIGELSPLTGPVEVIGKPLTRGHEVYFEYVNTELGGVGRDLPDDEKFQVELVTRDTQYVPDKHVEQFNALRNEVLAIGQSLGTPTTRAILPQLQDDPILTGPATLSVAWLTEPYMFPAGAPYAAQFINAADYITTELDRTPKAGIIYQDDDYGQEGLKGLEHAADAMGFEIVAQSTYKVGDQDFTAQVKQMKDAGADHVFLTAVPSAAAGILGTAAASGYAPQWIGQSPIWIKSLFTNEQLGPYLQENLWWVTDASCDWGESGDGCEGMGQMVKNIETFAPQQEPDVYFQFGYTQARILHEILEAAVANGDLTRQGVIDAFSELSDVDIGGLLNPVSFGANCEDRIPSTASNIFKVDPAQPLAVTAVAEVDSDALGDYPFCPEA